MKIFTLLFLIAFAGNALAELPKKAPVTRYAGLWTNSPFTSKPPPPKPGEDLNPLEDYALGGVAPIPGGYRVMLLNRKKPDERIILPNDPDFPDFKILSVEYGTGDPLESTTVRIGAGNKQGNVNFDKKLLTLKAPVAAPPQQPQLPQNMNNGANPVPGTIPPPNANVNGQPAPRPRVVASPTPGATAPNVPQIQRPNNVQTQRPQRR